MPPPPSTLPQNAILPNTAAGMARAADLIRQGKLVILPTETVYGIAVNLLSPHARAAAAALKGATPRWVLHVASPDAALAWAPHLSPLGQRLLAKALPGPVAFHIALTPEDAAAARARLGGGSGGEAADEVLTSGSQKPDSPVQHSAFSIQHSLTLRCPEFTQTQKIIELANVPIAILGAGTAAQPGVFELADLPEGILNLDTDRGGSEGGSGGGEGVIAAFDGGPTRYRRSSTVVSIDGDRFAVTRPGVIDERLIQKMADFVILFVCSGNTCRSPMAAAIATKILADRLRIHPSELPLRHIVVQSAGVHAQRGARAAREAIQATQTLGSDLSSHLSQPATPDVLRRADIIYTMTDAHRDELLEIAPAAARKIHRLDPEGDVADPIGSSLEVYQDVAEHLAELLQHRLSELRI